MNLSSIEGIIDNVSNVSGVDKLILTDTTGIIIESWSSANCSMENDNYIVMLMLESLDVSDKLANHSFKKVNQHIIFFEDNHFLLIEKSKQLNILIAIYGNESALISEVRFFLNEVVALLLK